jgi:integrase
MKQALSYAVKTGTLLYNVMDRVDAPKDTMYLPATYKREELLKLLDQAKSWSIFLPVLLAAYYGLRRSEVLGLRWSDIDFKDQLIRIEHKVLQEHDGDKNILAGHDKLKSQASRRTLPLIPVVDKALKNAYDDQLKHWGQVQEYICLNENGQLFNPDYLTNQFRELLELNGLRRIRFHDLRHTCATLLVLNGIPMKNVQLWLGHSDFRVTARYYAHLDFSAQKLSASTISTLLEPSE